MLVFGKLAEAVGALNAGSNLRAISLLTQILSDDVENASAHAFLSIALTRDRKPFAGAQEAEKALALDPELSVAHAAQATAAINMDDVPTAEAAISETLRLDPEDQHGLGLRCLLLLRSKKNFDGLKTAAQALIKYHPERSDGYYFASQAETRLGNATAGLAYAEDFLRISPNDSAGHEARGLALLKLSRVQEAKDAGLTALALEPESQTAKLLLLNCRLKEKKLLGWAPLVGMISSDIDLKKALKIAVPIFVFYLVFLDIANFLGLDDAAQNFRWIVLLVLALHWVCIAAYSSEVKKLFKEAQLKRGY